MPSQPVQQDILDKHLNFAKLIVFEMTIYKSGNVSHHADADGSGTFLKKFSDSSLITKSSKINCIGEGIEN
jgi:hypothetical protein